VRENTLRKIWARGEAVVNGWLSIPSSFSAEVMAHQGFDSLTVDMQHGVVDYQTAVTMLQAISTTPVIPLARVPWNDPALLMKILDAGVYGVICPMINTKAQAEALVAACKYAPRGYRSWGPVRASIKQIGRPVGLPTSQLASAAQPASCLGRSLPRAASIHFGCMIFETAYSATLRPIRVPCSSAVR
jgi:2-keto-3-deoxy-L-rhamnonate aldolase RhmA